MLSALLTLVTGASQGCLGLFTFLQMILFRSMILFYISSFLRMLLWKVLCKTLTKSAFGGGVSKMVNWYEAHNLQLNVKNTEEMIVNGGKKKTPLIPLLVKDQKVETVEHFLICSPPRPCQ